MKILLATYWSIPHLGGVWKYLSQLKSRLEELGHTVDIMGYGGENTYVQLSGGKTVPRDRWSPYVYSILKKEKFPKVYHNHLVEYTEVQRYTFELAAAEFGLSEYDIIHTHDVISTVAIDRVRPEGVPLVATLHGLVSHEIRHQLQTIHKSPTSELARPYFDEIERLGASSADVTITANDWLQEIMIEEFGVPKEQFEKLHYGFTVEQFLEEQAKPTSIQSPPDKKVIVYAGRLIELKGLDYLIDSLASLKDREDWVCWIIGEGDWKQHLEARVNELGMQKQVLFLGKREDVPVLLKLADICVLPSLMDNQPLSVIEAQISGKAVIVTDAGGLPEMVNHGVTGLIVPKADTAALLSAIQTLLDDDAYRQILGEQAREWGVDHWSMKAGVDRLLEIYRRFVASSD
ncbi:glycosyltransferase family 4 protein [Terribacillus saccharophilus]|uniref:glycosyltransferase family 4 protein n=1 Tax=Terribacillus saccharophilus TaxID=361277 RepID=UPI000BA739D8|nr:glycosyltransferase family 4 protein [Terribacillus saccharophilus]PAF19065.1 glycosyl transferase [Terribacillus saccharophilus]